MGEFTGLEVSIKDAKRFKDEPGNWAYFSFGHKYPLKAEVSKNTAVACNKCHQDRHFSITGDQNRGRAVVR